MRLIDIGIELIPFGHNSPALQAVAFNIDPMGSIHPPGFVRYSLKGEFITKSTAEGALYPATKRSPKSLTKLS